MIGIPQRPRLIWVKVCVASYSWPWKVGVGQKPSLAIKRRTVTMETWSKDDGDVHVLLGPLQLTVGHGLEAKRRHILPHVERSPNGIMGLLRTHFGCHVLYAANKGRKGFYTGKTLEGITRSFSAFKRSKSIVNCSDKTYKWIILLVVYSEETLKNKIQSGNVNCVQMLWSMCYCGTEDNSRVSRTIPAHVNLHVLIMTPPKKNSTFTIYPACCHFTLILFANWELNGTICERKQLIPPLPALSCCRCGEDGTISCLWNLFSN